MKKKTKSGKQNNNILQQHKTTINLQTFRSYWIRRFFEISQIIKPMKLNGINKFLLPLRLAADFFSKSYPSRYIPFSIENLGSTTLPFEYSHIENNYPRESNNWKLLEISMKNEEIPLYRKIIKTIEISYKKAKKINDNEFQHNKMVQWQQYSMRWKKVMNFYYQLWMLNPKIKNKDTIIQIGHSLLYDKKYKNIKDSKKIINEYFIEYKKTNTINSLLLLLQKTTEYKMNSIVYIKFSKATLETRFCDKFLFFLHLHNVKNLPKVNNTTSTLDIVMFIRNWIASKENLLPCEENEKLCKLHVLLSLLEDDEDITAKLNQERNNIQQDGTSVDHDANNQDTNDTTTRKATIENTVDPEIDGTKKQGTFEESNSDENGEKNSTGDNTFPSKDDKGLLSDDDMSISEDSVSDTGSDSNENIASCLENTSGYNSGHLTYDSDSSSDIFYTDSNTREHDFINIQTSQEKKQHNLQIPEGTTNSEKQQQELQPPYMDENGIVHAPNVMWRIQSQNVWNNVGIILLFLKSIGIEPYFDDKADHKNYTSAKQKIKQCMTILKLYQPDNKNILINYKTSVKTWIYHSSCREEFFEQILQFYNLLTSSNIPVKTNEITYLQNYYDHCFNKKIVIDDGNINLKYVLEILNHFCNEHGQEGNKMWMIISKIVNSTPFL